MGGAANRTRAAGKTTATDPGVCPMRRARTAAIVRRVFRKIIAGCDGEASGQDALALASVLGRPARADVLAIGVYPDPLLPFPIVLSRHATMHEECERLLRADRDAIAPEARIRAVPSVSPALALRHAVEHEHADLLVLGSAHGTETGRVHAGRHARQLLHDAPCAVALTATGFATHPTELRRIVVGFDSSPEAAAALALARLLATAAGSRLHVLTAVDPMPPAASGGFAAMAYLAQDWDAIVELRRRQARALLDETIASADGIEAEVADGDPGMALCDASRTADLVIVGSRHWGPLARLVLGGTGEYVVRHAHCPVLLVPRHETETSQRTRDESVAGARSRPGSN